MSNCFCEQNHRVQGIACNLNSFGRCTHFCNGPYRPFAFVFTLVGTWEKTQAAGLHVYHKEWRWPSNSLFYHCLRYFGFRREDITNRLVWTVCYN